MSFLGFFFLTKRICIYDQECRCKSTKCWLRKPNYGVVTHNQNPSWYFFSKSKPFEKSQFKNPSFSLAILFSKSRTTLSSPPKAVQVRSKDGFFLILGDVVLLLNQTVLVRWRRGRRIAYQGKTDDRANPSFLGKTEKISPMTENVWFSTATQLGNVGISPHVARSIFEMIPTTRLFRHVNSICCKKAIRSKIKIKMNSLFLWKFCTSLDI